MNGKYDLYSLFMIILIGIFDFGGIACNIIGYQIGDASKVLWFENIDLISSILYQIFLFNSIPNKFELIGAVLFLITALIPLFEENI